MCRKLCFLLSLVMVLSMVSSSSGATLYFLDTVANNLWNDAGNWSTNALVHDAAWIPTAGDMVYTTGRIGPTTCLVQSGESMVTGGMKVGQYSYGILNIEGTLTANSAVTHGMGTGDLDEINIPTGGSFTFPSMIIGSSDGWGQFNLNGGTATCLGDFKPGSWAIDIIVGHIIGEVHLNAGDFYTVGMPMNEDGFMDVNEGRMLLTGNQVTLMSGYVDNGWIQANDTNDPRYVVVEYNAPLTKTIIRKATIEDLKKAYAPDPGLDVAGVTPDAVLSWMPGNDCVSHDIYFGKTNPPPNVVMGQGVGNETHNPPGDIDLDTVYYWRIDEFDGTTTWQGTVWSFTTTDGKATNPLPVDTGFATKDGQILSWDNGFYSTSSNVYMDRDKALVQARDASTFMGNTGGTTMPAGTLEREKIYYWAVDEVGPPDVAGNIWSFTAEGFDEWIPPISIVAVTCSGFTATRPPEKAFDHSGLDKALKCHDTAKGGMFEGILGDQHCAITYDVNDGNNLTSWVQAEFDKSYNIREMWVWNFNRTTEYDDTVRGLKDTFVQYSITGSNDGNDWTEVFDGQWARAPGAASDCYEGFSGTDFAGVAAKYVVIAPNLLQGSGNWGATPVTSFGLSEVRFRRSVEWATDPSPADGAVLPESARATLQLGWTAGLGAVQHDVYFGDDYGLVYVAGTGDAEYRPPRQAGTTWDASGEPMVLGGTYYWRIDEVDSGNKVEKGMVWQYSIIDYLVIDDFESYNCTGGTAPWDVWHDGYYNGSTAWVGTSDGQTAHCETTIVNYSESGSTQSLYYKYRNSLSPNWAEGDAATSLLPIGTDWNRDGVAAIDIWFRGTTGNAGEQMSVKLLDGTLTNEVDYPGSAGDLAKEEWQVWRTQLCDFNTVDLDALTQITIRFDGGAGDGVMYFDDLRLYAPRCIPELIAGYPEADIDESCRVDYKDLRLMAAKWLQLVPPSVPKPVAYYPLNGNADDAVGTEDGTEYGSPAYDVGKIGLALDCDGNDDLLVMWDDDTTEFSTESFSVSYWFKPSGLALGFNYVLINGSCGASEWGHPKPASGNRYETAYNEITGDIMWVIDQDLGNLKSEIRGKDMSWVDGDWHSVVCVRDADVGELRFFVDGAPYGAVVKPYCSVDITSVNEPLVVGVLPRMLTGVHASKNDGMIDEIKFFDSALSPTQAAELAVGTGMMAQYKFNGNANDSVGIQHGTENGGPSYQYAKYDYGILLDGTDDYVMVPDGGTTEFSTESFSLSYWFSIDNNDATWNYVAINGSCGTEWSGTKPPGGNRYETGIRGSDGQLFFCIDQDTGNLKSDIRGIDPNLVDGAWHHVVCVRDAEVGEQRLFVDGAPFGAVTKPYTSINIASPNEPLTMGARWSGSAWIDCFDGMLDEIRFYNYPMVEADLKEAAYSPPVALWKMDSASGGVTPEEMTGDDGTLMGGAAIVADPIKGNVLSLDGVDDSVDVPFGGAKEVSDHAWTVDWWAMCPGPADGSEQMINSGSWGGEGADPPYVGKRYELTYLMTGGAPTIHLAVDDDVDKAQKTSDDLTTAGFAYNEWGHIAIVRYEDEWIRTYYNAQEVASQQGSMQGPNPGGRIADIDENLPLHIGANLPEISGREFHFEGLMDEVTVHDFGLSQAQILDRMVPTGMPEDLNTSGLVNFEDYAILADQWMDTVGWPECMP